MLDNIDIVKLNGTLAHNLYYATLFEGANFFSVFTLKKPQTGLSKLCPRTAIAE